MAPPAGRWRSKGGDQPLGPWLLISVARAHARSPPGRMTHEILVSPLPGPGRPAGGPCGAPGGGGGSFAGFAPWIALGVVITAGLPIWASWLEPNPGEQGLDRHEPGDVEELRRPWLSARRGATELRHAKRPVERDARPIEELLMESQICDKMQQHLDSSTHHPPSARPAIGSHADPGDWGRNC